MSLSFKRCVFFLFVNVTLTLTAFGDSDTTLGDLSARIEELENQMGSRDNHDDTNPGTKVSSDDFAELKEQIRSLKDEQANLQAQIQALKAEKYSSSNVEKSFSHSEEKEEDDDDEIESVLKLLERSAPAGESKSKEDLEKTRNSAAKQAEATAPMLSVGNAQAQYNEAFALYEKKAYKEAQKAFRYFIKTYPKDTLVSTAMYWEADTTLKLGHKKEAKVLFVNAFKKNPKGPKAPESLLKLGEILAIEGRLEDAKTAWAKLQKDFPHMSKEISSLKEKYTNEKSKKSVRKKSASES